LHNISNKNKELDAKGIHFNSIKNNKELYKLYKEKSDTYKKKKEEANKKQKRSLEYEEPISDEFEHLKSDRNLKYTARKYMRLTKVELVKRLIQAGYYIAKGNEEELRNIFETFEG
jgi:hypothetical protein